MRGLVFYKLLAEVAEVEKQSEPESLFPARRAEGVFFGSDACELAAAARSRGSPRC